ncbi:MAG: hypothetical protein QOG53_1120 [Frankiales bacterium]|jgi:SpoIID/LytB domain protein|nr:hypothetical protein [Frankiales bacterium]
MTKPRRCAALLTGLGLLAGGIVVGLGDAARADQTVTIPGAGTIRMSGHGWGHGRGMSQQGAYGAAAVKHLSATEILSFYYAHTSAGAIGNPTIRVKLTEAAANYVDALKPTGSGAAVQIHDSGSTQYTGNLPDATKYRFTAGSSGVTVSRWTGSSWQLLTLGGHSWFPGPVNINFLSNPAPAGRTRVLLPNGVERDYRGYLRVVYNGSGSLTTTSVATMDEYLRGVVPRESPSSWPMAALQAQAAAARSYAQYKRQHAGSASYDICDSTSCQVFKGVREVSAGGTVTNLETNNTNNAVTSTSGSVRIYQGQAIFAEYSSSNGGWTTDGGSPYLIARPDPYDGMVSSSTHSWQASVPASALESRYPAIGNLRRIRVTSRDGNGQWGGRVLSAVLEGSAGSVTVTGSDVYKAYSWPTYSKGMKSSWWQLFPIPTNDFDGNMRSDFVIWRPSEATFYIKDQQNVPLGHSGDVAMPADYNGDGKVEAAVYNPSTHRWYIPGRESVAYGISGDIPVAGDFDGNGAADIAVWRPSSGTWYVLGMPTVAWGIKTDIPVPADYNGDGTTDIAVWRPSTGRWYVKDRNSVAYGVPKDVPVPGDYNGDGSADFAVWRPSSHTYYKRNLGTVVFGSSGDIPQPGDYNNDGITDVMLYRPSDGTWTQYGGGTTRWGVPGDRALGLPYAIDRAT